MLHRSLSEPMSRNVCISDVTVSVKASEIIGYCLLFAEVKCIVSHSVTVSGTVLFCSEVGPFALQPMYLYGLFTSLCSFILRQIK